MNAIEVTREVSQQAIGPYHNRWFLRRAYLVLFRLDLCA